MVCCSAPFVIGGELLPCGSCLACREVARELVEPLLSYVSALPEGCAVCGLPVMPEAAACIRSVRMDPATMRSRMLSPSAMRPIGTAGSCRLILRGRRPSCCGFVSSCCALCSRR